MSEGECNSMKRQGRNGEGERGGGLRERGGMSEREKVCETSFIHSFEQWS